MPTAIKANPAASCVQNRGISVETALPISMLTPSMRVNANIAPLRMERQPCLEQSVITANCVLSPSSAKKTKEKGTKNVVKSILGLVFKFEFPLAPIVLRFLIWRANSTSNFKIWVQFFSKTF